MKSQSFAFLIAAMLSAFSTSPGRAQELPAHVFPTLVLEDGRAAILAQLVSIDENGTAEVKPISDASSSADDEAPSHFFDALDVVPAAGYMGILGSNVELVFVIGKRSAPNDITGSSVEGVAAGASVGTNGAEASLGYGVAGLVGRSIAISYIKDWATPDTREWIGLKGAFNILIFQVKAGLYLDGSRAKVIPVVGAGIALPVPLISRF